MHYAVRTASSQAIKILLLYNVDINHQDNVCLTIPPCCLCAFSQCVPILLLSLFFCLIQDGWTPLHLAVQARRTDLVRLLLIKGADKTLKNKVKGINL
jgi:ankyrin repeat protein